MNKHPWYRSLVALLAASLLLPPVGLLLLWIRTGASVLRKVLGTVVIGGLTVAHLVLFFGLHAEMDGSGMHPIFSFYKRESHYAELERSRAQQPKVVEAAAAASPEPKPTSAPETAPTTPPAQPAASVAEPPAKTGRTEAYWTDFRGPRRDGVYDEMPILTSWPSQGLPKLWKQPVGGGYASFTIAEGKAFTIEQRRTREVVAAYDVETGRELWTNGWEAFFQETMGGDGPRATPTWDGGRVYALGATGEFRCLDAATGKLLWRHDILAENGASNLTWGMAASPLIVDEKVIVLPGGRGGKSVVAYHKLTGERIWSVVNDQQAYTSPMLVTLAGRRQLLVVSAERAMGLVPEDGSLLWDFPWTTDYGINSAQPLLLGENRFFISASYGHGGAAVEVVKSGEGYTARTVWQNTRMKSKFSGPVLYKGYIYGLDENILACVDAATGELKWKSGRYGYGQVLLAEGHLIVLTESGEVALVKATPERHQELARFPAIEGKTWNVPAISGGRLLVRNTTEMACFRIGAR